MTKLPETSEDPTGEKTLHTYPSVGHPEKASLTMNLTQRLAQSLISEGTNRTTSALEEMYRTLDGSTRNYTINGTHSNSTNRSSEEFQGEVNRGWILNELQLIKAVVLSVVVVALLVSTCRVVFKTFSRYSDAERPGDNKE